METQSGENSIRLIHAAGIFVIYHDCLFRLWKGALNNGRVGLFSPDLTVAYVGTLPSQGNHSKWHNEDLYQSANS